MDDFPQVGMTHQQAKDRIKANDGRPDKDNRNRYLINQVLKHEGLESAKDIAHKINKDHK